AAELGPADLLEHVGQGLAAAVAVRGGANSHAAIIARSVGLPLVVGVDPAVLDLPDGTALLVDAEVGVVVVDPAAAEVARADAASVRDGERRALLAAERWWTHATADGQPFELLCNVASDTEVRIGQDSGASGVGLLRTELPFVAADRWPTEADHRRALRPILSEAAGAPGTVRRAGRSACAATPGATRRPCRSCWAPAYGPSASPVPASTRPATACAASTPPPARDCSPRPCTCLTPTRSPPSSGPASPTPSPRPP